ncbi:MAG TPA: VOC family protein, partial [Caldithrix abyssi]|nr:VOC family protein [Caldithrix abyssi]
LDGYLEKAQKAGAQVDVPKMPVKGIGWIAYCKDTEGNLFGMIQYDPNAA